MASAFGTNTPNYSSSDFTNNRRMLTNYNYVKNIVRDTKNQNSYCLNSANGNVILKPVALRCNPNPLTENSKLQIKESGNLAGSCKKLGYVRSYQLLSDITKGFIHLFVIVNQIMVIIFIQMHKVYVVILMVQKNLILMVICSLVCIIQNLI